MPIELPILTVANASAWRQWLTKNHSISPGVWLTNAKKGTTKPTSLTYPQALEEALCYGWIDGQALPGDTSTYKRRFTPRRSKSTWSARNVTIFSLLEIEGRMEEPGRIAAEAAKKDGRWDAAYAGPATAEPPEDFLLRLKEVPSALTMWEGLDSKNRYAIYVRLVNLKTVAGRENRMKAFVDMLAKGETPIPANKVVESGAVPTPRKSVKKTKVTRDNAPKAVKAINQASGRRTRSGRHVPDKY